MFRVAISSVHRCLTAPALVVILCGLFWSGGAGAEKLTRKKVDGILQEFQDGLKLPDGSATTLFDFDTGKLAEYFTGWDTDAAKRRGAIFAPRARVDAEARHITEAEVRLWTRLGMEVIVEKDMGVNRDSGKTYVSNQTYKDAGARVLDSTEFEREARRRKGGSVASTKEPQRSEYPIIKGRRLLTYLHLAAEPDLAKELAIGSGKVAAAFAMETIEGRDGRPLPLLGPASDAAGWLSAARFATAVETGPTNTDTVRDAAFAKNIANYPSPPQHLVDQQILKGKNMVVLGGGAVGQNAAEFAARVGANVTITDVSEEKIDSLRAHFDAKGLGDRVTVLRREDPKTRLPDAPKDADIAKAVRDAHAIVGAILLPGGKAPTEIDRDFANELARAGKLQMIADVGIDQGGNLDFARHPSAKKKYSDGWMRIPGSRVHDFSFTNMPSQLPEAVSKGIAAGRGVLMAVVHMNHFGRAFHFFPGLRPGLNIYRGAVTHDGAHRAIQGTHPEIAYRNAPQARAPASGRRSRR